MCYALRLTCDYYNILFSSCQFMYCYFSYLYNTIDICITINYINFMKYQYIIKYFVRV
nr:MAG TPA: hypothetical protein [Caudoviricetes sp.]